MTNSLIQQAQALAEQGLVQDMTEAPSGSGGRLLPEGTALVRLTGYIEVGKHVKDYNGKPKPATPQFYLQGHIVGGAGTTDTGETEEYVQDGKFIVKTSKELALSLGDLATATKIFKALKGNKPYTSFVQLLNSVFLIPITHNKSTDGKKTYVNVEWDKAMPAVDPMTRKAYDAPEVPPEEFKVLLWDAPTQEQWDSIFIDGEWEGKDGKPNESKNKYQLRCYEATNFAGSALEQLLAGGSIPSLVADPEGSAEIPDVPEA